MTVQELIEALKTCDDPDRPVVLQDHRYDHDEVSDIDVDYTAEDRKGRKTVWVNIVPGGGHVDEHGNYWGDMTYAPDGAQMP